MPFLKTIVLKIKVLACIAFRIHFKMTSVNHMNMIFKQTQTWLLVVTISFHGNQIAQE